MQGFNLTSEMLAALVGVGIALIAQVVVNIFSSLDETKKWKRQQMVQAYQQCLSAIGKLDNDARILIQFRNDPKSSFPKMIENCQQSIEAANLAIANVQIAASDKFLERLNTYSKTVSECILDVHGTIEHGWTLVRFENSFSPLKGKVVDQAQQDLGFRRRWNRRPTAD